jgi:hypothetical protein
MAEMPFIGGAYKARGSQLNAQECVNLFAEFDESGEGRSRGALIGTPGLSLFTTAAGSGVNRRIYVTATGRLYAVRGATLSEIAANGTATAVGTLETTIGNVSITDNGFELLAVDGVRGYLVDLSDNSFSKLNASTFPAGATHAAFHDQLFIVNKGNTGEFYTSGVLDGTDWDVLRYATAEGSADNLVGIYSNGANLYLLGTESTEVWYNSGDSAFTFDRVPGALLDVGCAAPFSPAVLNDRLFWLGGSSEGYGTVWAMQGYQPQRVSTHAIEKDIGDMTAISDAVGWAYQQEGHAFYVLTFPTGNKTYCFDSSTGLWHRRAYLDPYTKDYQRHLGLCHAFFRNQHIVADWRNGNLYRMGLETYSDNTAAILRRRTMAHIANEGKRMRYASLQIDAEMGVGLQTGQGSNPHIMMQYSDDGGKTWSNERWAGLGKVGQYAARAVWRKLGISRSRVFKIEISDPVQVHLTNAYIDLQPTE